MSVYTDRVQKRDRSWRFSKFEQGENNMRKVAIVGAARTPVGAFGGSLKSVSVVQLGALAIRKMLEKSGVRPIAGSDTLDIAPGALDNQRKLVIEEANASYDQGLIPVSIDEVIMGNVLQAGQGQNTARQAMFAAGLLRETPAFSVNKICGSGLKAVALGAQAIAMGEADVIVAGGQESMSNVPMALPKARWGHKMELTGVGEIYDLMVYDGLYEIFYGYHMGITAENIAQKYSISRQEQDELALLSHSRAFAAVQDGTFAEEIVPVNIVRRRQESVVEKDERPSKTSMEKLGRLRPAFSKDGTVTAGNASGINDGAAAVLLMSEERAAELGLQPLAFVETFAAGGLDPAYMGLGPVPAVKRVLKNTGMTVTDLDMIELNEAFASQAIGCMRELGIEVDRPNELGSGISLGHPIGCTGARQVVTAVHHMQRKGYGNALITMCIGGGMGMAMIISR